MNNEEGLDRLRDVEMRLFTEIGTQLKILGADFKEFTEKMSLRMEDVRERLTRIEASNEAGRIDKLEAELNSVKMAQHEDEKRMVRMETIIAPITVIGAALASTLISVLLEKIF